MGSWAAGHLGVWACVRVCLWELVDAISDKLGESARHPEPEWSATPASEHANGSWQDERTASWAGRGRGRGVSLRTARVRDVRTRCESDHLAPSWVPLSQPETACHAQFLDIVHVASVRGHGAPDGGLGAAEL